MADYTFTSNETLGVQESPQQEAIMNYDFVSNEYLEVEDSQEISPPSLLLQKRIVILNISTNNVVVDTVDNATRGFLTRGFVADLDPTEGLDIPIESYSSIDPSIKAKFVAMARAQLIQVWEVTAQNASQRMLTGAEIMTVS